MKNPNGFGSVYKLHGNRRKPFAACVTVGRDGKRCIRKYIGYYETQREALSALAEYHNKPYDISARDITVFELYEKWIAWREEREKGKEANRIYKITFNKHCRDLHEWRFLDVQSIHIQRLIDSAKSPKTAARIKLLWGLFYKYAALLGLCHVNAAAIVETPTQPKSKLHKPFTDEEIEELWKNTKDGGAKIALILIYSGLRPSELATIKTENIHLKERYMVGGMKTDAGRGRTIPIAEKIFPFISALYNPNKPRLFRFSNYQGIAHEWKMSTVPAVQNHLPHDGRHTCETLLDNARVAKKTIQLILGHAGRDIDDTVYTHKTRQQLIDAINMI